MKAPTPRLLLTIVALLLLVASSASSATLLGWWQAEGSSSDAAGSNHGTLEGGASFSQGRVGQGFALNGSTTYIRIPHNGSNLKPGSGSFTLLAWVKTSKSDGWQAIVGQYEGGGAQFGLSAYAASVVSGKLRFDLRDTDGGGDPAPDVGGGQKLEGTNIVADGAFHHVAFVRDIDSNQVHIYLDGALEASATMNAGATNAIMDDDGEEDPFTIGAGQNTHQSTFGANFEGIIDDVQYWAGALSEQQIIQAGRLKVTRLSWWQAEGNANDAVGPNHGSLSNLSAFVEARIGQGFRCNGSNSYVRVPHTGSNLQPSVGSFSLLAWINTTNSNGWRSIISQYEGGGAQFGLSAYAASIVSGRLRFDLRDTDGGGDPSPTVLGGQKLEATNLVADGVFHHTAFVRDTEAGQMLIYLDSVLVASAALNAGATGPIQDDDGEDDPVSIGAGQDTYLETFGAHFDGVVDDVQYWSGALSQQQIIQAGRWFRLAITSAGPLATLQLHGATGHTYRIEFTPGLSASNHWSELTNIDLFPSPYYWTDPETPFVPQRLFRALQLP